MRHGLTQRKAAAGLKARFAAPTSCAMAGGQTTFEIALDSSHAGWRLDRALAARVPTLSRERLKVLTKAGA